ncbi:MAG: DUF2141 domain-containing protein [Pontixanthobacter sp.]
MKSAAVAASALFLVGNSAPAPVTGSVSVTITDLRSDKGVVRACMTRDPKRFPDCRDGDVTYRTIVKADETVHFSFPAVKPGRYAIALLHDENNNGKADRALMMMPTEGYGFSRDAKVRLGPPRFRDAAFDVAPRKQTHTIAMRYML